MIHLADVNVVFAILVENHVHHAQAWKWWAAREDASVGLCLPVRLGVLRLLTNSTAMEGSPVTPAEALVAWEKFSHDPRTRWLDSPGLSHERHFRKLVEARRPTPNLWTDAWLAALAESLAIGLTSFDGGFRRHALRDFELLKG